MSTTTARTVALAAALVLVAAGCGEDTAHTAGDGGTATETYTAATTTTLKIGDPQKVADHVQKLWKAPRATQISRRGERSPRARAVDELLASHVAGAVLTDKDVVMRLLGPPDRRVGKRTWNYLLSVRTPVHDRCTRTLEIEFASDGSFSSLEEDGDEHCRSD
jgi:hypothetical protein